MYITLSKVIPKIKKIIFNLADETLILSDNTLFLDENTVFRLEDEEVQPINFDDKEVIILLDLYYKDLDFLDDDSEKQLIIQKLYNKFSELEEQASELSICLTLPNTEPAI
ncbi:22679_t:CDS:2 [Cetraspora pellucida]|uniref:22679_t:CDS:1 n=1 Tax=Cetraspora pellucida TaxID=1433469 RepID=A0A9N9A9C4_9GLOM|nr:22679_t:CDS:2 [Cetraspora pellucida]